MKKLSLKRTLMLVLSSLFSIFLCGSSCKVGDGSNISVQQDKDGQILVYQDDFVFDEYFSNTYLTITGSDGEQYFVELDESMLLNSVDTSTVGEKSLQIGYNEKIVNIKYFVKYKVEFLVDGNILDTQYVLNKSELDLFKIPTKEGFTFISWEEIDGEINSNIQINAIFSEDVVLPNLSQITATYGDRLSSLTLPSNKFGSWEFVDDTTNFVGNAGENIFDVQFVLNNSQVFKTDQIVVNVSKKTVEFNVQSLELIYDGTNKTPSYDLVGVDKNLIKVNYNTLNSDTKNVGKYYFELVIEDENYQGNYVGQFTIIKKQVKIEINSQRMDYLSPIPTFDFVVYDTNRQELSSKLVEEMNISLDVPTISPQVGEYEIDLIYTNFENFEIVEKTVGKLTVEKITHDVDLEINQDKTIFGAYLTNADLKSTISKEFGKWSLVDGNVQINEPDKFTIKVKFTPTDTRNYNIIEKGYTFAVSKKTVEINVANNQFTYDGSEKTLEYTVDGVIDDDYEILGNISCVDANEDGYDITLSLSSEKYTATSVKTKLIINKANLVNFDDEQALLSEITYNHENASKLNHVSLSNGYAWVNGEQNLLIGENSYDVKYTPSDLNNYYVQTGTLKLKVNKAQSQITVIGSDNLVYTYNSTNVYNFNVTVNNNEQILIKTYEYNGKVVNGLTDSGVYTVTILAQETAHYIEQTKVVVITIKKIENNDEISTLINATYLDKLEIYSKLLPLSSNGLWTWQEDNSTLVGNVGKQTHNAVFTPNNATNYSSRIVEITFNVSKFTVNVPSLDNDSYIYNGNTIKPIVQENSLYNIENDGGITVGEYLVKLTLVDDKNYIWSNGNVKDVRLNYNIQKATNSWTNISSLSKPQWTYGEDFASVNNGTAKFGDVTVKYVGVGNNYNSIEMPTNAGSYKAIFTVTGTDNYTNLVKEIEFTIKKVVIVVPNNQIVDYTGEKLFANIENNALYSVIENSGGVLAGEYDVKVKLNNFDNYCWNTVDTETVIFKLVIQQAGDNSWVINPIISNWVYNSQPSQPKYQSRFGEVNVRYVGVGNNYDSNEIPTNAGSYKAIFTVTETDSYAGLVKEIEFTIEKVVIAVQTLNTKTFSYNGNLIKPTIAKNDAYKITNDGGVNVGNYNVILSLLDKDNYVWSNNRVEDVTLNYEITKATNSWTVSPSLSKLQWTYGEDFASVNNGTAKFGDVTVKYLDANLTELNQIPTIAGSYKAIFTVTGTDNYTNLVKEIEFTIEKSIVNIPSLDSYAFFYTGNLIKPTVQENSLYTVENKGGINAGEYDVKASLIDDKNYIWSNGSNNQLIINYSITKADNCWNKNPNIDKTVWAYGEQVTVDLGDAKFGDVTVEYFDLNNVKYSVIPTNAGEYYAIFSVLGNNNYSSLSYKFDFTINRCEIVITPPNFVNEHYENEIDFTNFAIFENLPSLSNNVSGEFIYKLELGQSIVDGQVNVIVSFIPSNENYLANDVIAKINVKTIATIGELNYGSIESALTNATSGNVVWVVIDKGIVIRQNCTVPSGVTLNIPHTANSMNANNTAELNGKVYATAPTIEILNIVTINENVTLTNYGTIQVAGQLSGGGGGHAYAGHTAGKSAKIVLKKNSKIENIGGSINLFGLILEETTNNGSQVIINGGNLSLPFVVRDFRGGSYMYAINNLNTVAFNEFEFRNVTAHVTVKNQANVSGYANLYAGDKHNSTIISLVSTTKSSVIQFNDENGYLTFKYNIVGGYSGNDAWIDGIMTLNIFGGAKTNAMSLKIVYVTTVTVSTQSVFFPISWRFNVALYDGVYSMQQKFKLMPGAVFTVGEGANLTINQLAIYDKLTYDTAYENSLKGTPNPHYTKIAGTSNDRTYNNTDAQFIIKSGAEATISGFVGGNVTVENGGTFNYQTSSVKYYCSDCNAYYDSKCTKKKLLIFTHSSTQETTILITIQSPEGKKVSDEGLLAEGENEYLTFNLTINGEQP